MWSETGGSRVSGPEKAHASSIRARRRGRRERVAAGRDCLSGPTGSFGRGLGGIERGVVTAMRALRRC